MWCRSILCGRALFSNVSVFEKLRCSMSNSFNGIPLKDPILRSLVSTSRESTVGDIIDQWSHRFVTEGIPEPVESIEHIVAHILGTKKITDVVNVRNDWLGASQIEKLEALCECRLSRMPVQYIIGEWDFRDITIKLVPPIFIPRPETEILVDFILKRLKSLQAESYEILEIGCGSGAISLALTHACKRIKCTAIDASSHACALTVTNRDKLNLTHQIAVAHATLQPDARIEVSSILNSTDDVNLNLKLFDFIVSNPPYVPTKDLLDLEPEIKIYEDLRALDGGTDGLKIIKPLLKYAAKTLKPGGRLFLEVDPSHPEYIQFFTKKYSDLKLHHEHTYKDFCNNNRFVEILKIV